MKIYANVSVSEAIRSCSIGQMQERLVALEIDDEVLSNMTEQQRELLGESVEYSDKDGRYYLRSLRVDSNTGRVERSGSFNAYLNAVAIEGLLEYLDTAKVKLDEDKAERLAKIERAEQDRRDRTLVVVTERQTRETQYRYDFRVDPNDTRETSIWVKKLVPDWPFSVCEEICESKEAKAWLAELDAGNEFLLQQAILLEQNKRAEALEWISQYGSEPLREMAQRGMSFTKLYEQEREAKDKSLVDAFIAQHVPLAVQAGSTWMFGQPHETPTHLEWRWLKCYEALPWVVQAELRHVDDLDVFDRLWDFENRFGEDWRDELENQDEGEVPLWIEETDSVMLKLVITVPDVKEPVEVLLRKYDCSRLFNERAILQDTVHHRAINIGNSFD